MASRRRVCVVGGGVLGLPTAYRLLEELPNVDVTIVAEKFSPNTTGDGSAGFWRPYFIGGTSEEQIWKWGKETYDHLHALSCSTQGGLLNICQATGYDIYRNPEREAFWKDIVLGYRPMTDAELKQFPGGYRYGYAYTSLLVDCKKYLPWLLEKFHAKGGKCVQQKVEKLSDLADSYDVIVNCTGVWARHLVNDQEIEPLKGQIIKVDAPWVKHFINAEEDDLYILATSRAIVMGGTHESGVWNLNIDPVQRERIWKGCCRLVPSLEAAKVIENWSGLRPKRTSVRLEKEVIRVANHTIPVVHNYGHGGSGVTLHWGCAGDAVKLVQQSLDGLHSKL